MSTPLLRIFVYGSLKRGFNNHDIYCRGVRSAEPASTPGRLYRVPTGYPALTLPANRVLARGSGDPPVDLQSQHDVERMLAAADSARGPIRCGSTKVHGELMTFADPVERLRAIDALEEFRPGRRNRYDRVLIQVYSRCRQANVVAWTYLAGPLSAQRRLISTGKWVG